MKSKTLIFLLVLSSLACKVPAPLVIETATSKPSFSFELLISAGDSLPYRLLLPQNFNKNRSYPLVLFLHGAGERGKDNDLQLVHGAELFLQAEVRQKYPAIIVFPQCPEEETWSNTTYEWNEDGSLDLTHYADAPINKNQILLKALLSKLNLQYRLDHQRFYVGGLSMGGMGTFEIVRQNPRLFAAAFPICGGAHPATADKLSSTPWWIFHGEEDRVVHVDNSKKMYNALKEAGAMVKLSLYPGTGHDSWTKAFAEPELLEWMFAQQLK